jgi:hypothetical protein
MIMALTAVGLLMTMRMIVAGMVVTGVVIGIGMRISHGP